MVNILISPSKTMAYSGLENIKLSENLVDGKLSDSILNQLNSMDYDALKTLYKSSDKVIQEAAKANENKGCYKSINLFNGAVFKNMGLDDLEVSALKYMDEHVYIFSALYGVVRADDGITSYRLDLNNPLKVENNNLTKLWKDKVSSYLNGLEGDYILDLASSEYRKLMDYKTIDKQIITIDFKDQVKGIYKTKGTYAKMARGQFVRALAMECVHSLDVLKTLSVMDYQYNCELSNDSMMIYTR